MRRPWRRMALMVSGKSLIVERIMRLSFPGRRRRGSSGCSKVVSSRSCGGRAAQRDRSVAQDVGPLRDRQAEVHVLLDEEHGGAGFVGDRPHGRQESLHRDRRESEAQLVDEQQARVACQRAGDGEHLLLAAREQTGRRAEPRLQLGEEVERVDRVPAARRAAGSRGRSASGTVRGRPGSTRRRGGRCGARATGRHGRPRAGSRR